MAISINKYVSIQSYLPSADGGNPSSLFNCLLITPEEMVETSDPKLAAIKQAYDDGRIVTPTKEQAAILFSSTTDTFKFVSGYNGYVSPSQNATTDLLLFKMQNGEKPSSAYARANLESISFTGVSFIPPSDSGESSAGNDWFDELTIVASALGSNKILVVNYKADGNPDGAVTVATKFQTKAPVIMVYGANNWSGFTAMAALGATMFSAGVSTSFMYRQFADDAAVFDKATSDLLDASFINYIGVTQSNGSLIKFYQRGYNLDGTDTTEYLNEMWFKNQCEFSLIQRLAGGEPIPYDATGVYIVKNLVTGIADQAVTNGVFLKTNPSDAEIAIVQGMVAKANDTVSYDEVNYALNVNGYYIYAYLSRSPSDEPSIAYLVAYGSGASIKFIQGIDYVVR